MDKRMAMQRRVLSYNKDMIRTLLPFFEVGLFKGLLDYQ